MSPSLKWAAFFFVAILCSSCLENAFDRIGCTISMNTVCEQTLPDGRKLRFSFSARQEEYVRGDRACDREAATSSYEKEPWWGWSCGTDGVPKDDGNGIMSCVAGPARYVYTRGTTSVEYSVDDLTGSIPCVRTSDGNTHP